MSLENHGEGRYTVPGQSRDFSSYYSVLGYSDTGVAGRYTVPEWEVLHCAPLKS